MKIFRSLKTYLPTMGLLFLTSCGKSNSMNLSQEQEAWNEPNSPAQLINDYIVRLESLPLKGYTGQTPWADSYCRANQGGISYRWRDDATDPFGYTPPTLEKLKTMSSDSISKLSPAEKYDIYRGRYEYPTVISQRNKFKREMQDWAGLCHGWASAAINFKEPKSVTLRNAEGINIPFGSSDIKALLTFAQAYNSKLRMLGQRCNKVIDPSGPIPMDIECRDSNAGAFHIILANQIGRLKKSFVIDRTRDQQVWNYPVYRYQTKIIEFQSPSPRAAQGTTKEAVVETEIRTGTIIAPTWDAVVGTNRNRIKKITYRYILELNEAGDIIGGEWANFERPDFLAIREYPRFSGEYSEIEKIYKLSLN